MKNNNDNAHDEIIDVEAYTKADKKPPVGKKYKVKIDNEFFVFDHHLVTGKEILEKDGKKNADCYTLYQKFKHCDFEKIDPDDKVDLAKPGVEHFVVKPPLVFNYTVDAEPETTDKKSLTPNQILELAGLKAADHYLVLVNPDGSQVSYKDNPTANIEMKCPGLKFISVFRGEVPVSFKN